MPYSSGLQLPRSGEQLSFTKQVLRLSVVVALGIAKSAGAGVIHVPSVEPTIQAGLSAASSGDTVLVASGTYTGPGNRNLDFLGKDLVLLSSSGAMMTVIDCQGLGRGIHFHSGEAALVSGFTIRSGSAQGTFGGAVLIEGAATPMLVECRFESNHANAGGGVFVSSSVALVDCEFAGNAADNWGGGLYAESAIVDAAGCSFSQNVASIGAAVYVTLGASATLSDCSFVANIPVNRAGGVYSSGCDLTVERCSFVENRGKEGAGMYLLGGTASVNDCTFRQNAADWSGGGIRAERVESFRVTGCTFEDNATLSVPASTYAGGGGIHFLAFEQLNIEPYIADSRFVSNRSLGTENSGAAGGGMSIGSRDALVERCEFVNNHADHVGGGANCSGRLRDCVFEGNSALSGGGLWGGKEITDCRFDQNYAFLDGGGCIPSGGAVPGAAVIHCEFHRNSASRRGGGLYWITFQELVIEDSWFSGNYASEGGGVFMYNDRSASVSGCTFEQNTAGSTGGGVAVTGPATSLHVMFSRCTLVGNGAPLGGGVISGLPVSIENSIIAFGAGGEAIRCQAVPPVLSCTNIYGNAGGDWTGCIADQLGINGCFSADPLFCNAVAGDYTLAETSPCAPAHSPVGCGLIGAHPVACAAPIGIADEGAPRISPLLRVLPNPLRGVGTIEWMGAGVVPELRLYDVGGRLVARRSGEGGGGRMSWSELTRGGDMASGVYFLELGSDGGGEVAARVRLVVIR